MIKPSRRPLIRSVVFVSTGLGNGGAERQLTYLAQGLKKRGWNVQVLTLLTPASQVLMDELSLNGISVVSLDAEISMSPQNLWRLLWRAWRQIRRWCPDILVGWMVHSALLVRIIGPFSSARRVVISLRTARSQAHWQDRALALTDGLSTRVVTNSKLAAQVQLREHVVSPRKIQVIYNGLDNERLRPTQQPRAALQFLKPLKAEQKRTFKWLAVGRADVEKDYPTLLKAVQKLPPSGWRLWIVGGGRQLDDIKALAQQMSLEDRVIFLGHRDDVPLLLEEADAVVMSSVVEGLPNALIEAHAASLPVVTTDVGGAREIVSDGRTGFVVPAGNPAELAQAMQHMMELEPQQRIAMGLAGHHHVKENFVMHVMIDQWEDVLLGNGSTKATTAVDSSSKKN